jgi:hypothetical protein
MKKWLYGNGFFDLKLGDVFDLNLKREGGRNGNK